MATGRSVTEVKARSKLLLDKLELIRLVHESGSPTAAYIVVLVETKNDELAKAGRWLAILRRDYYEEYENLVGSILNQATEAR